MNDLEKMEKEIEIKKKALNAIYGKDSIENNLVTFTESIWYIYDILNSKIENARYRYEVTKDPELKGEIDAYYDIITLLETKYTFLSMHDNKDLEKLPSGFVRRLTNVIVCPCCNSNNIESMYKISRVNNWDEQKLEKVSIKYKCSNCGKEFFVEVMDNTNKNNIDSDNVDHEKKIPYNDDTSFCYVTQENKDA